MDVLRRGMLWGQSIRSYVYRKLNGHAWYFTDAPLPQEISEVRDGVLRIPDQL